MKYILDTSILISVERGDKIIRNKVDEFINKESIFFITVLNYSEFFYGYAGKSSDDKKSATNFLSKFSVLTLSKKSAETYAELSYKYDKKGTKVDAFDLLTASIAIENDATIITEDTDFEKVEEAKKEILRE